MKLKPLEEFPNYGVTTDGKVYNLKTHKQKKSRIGDQGYEFVTLYKNNKSKRRTVHRLVALQYIPNPDNLPEINHKDGNKLNNIVENLEWCDHSYNIQHVWDTGLLTNTEQRVQKLRNYNKEIHKYGLNYQAKRVQCIETLEIFDSITRAEHYYNITPGAITLVCTGRQKFTKTNINRNLTWRYYE